MEGREKGNLSLPVFLLLFFFVSSSSDFLAFGEEVAGRQGINETKKHFVLVHGFNMGAWCWYKLATLLRERGHSVTALDLAGSGISRKGVGEVRTLVDYTQPLLDFLRSVGSRHENGSHGDQEKVILVGHSFGGWNLALAMEKFPHKVSVAVLVAAFMARPSMAVQLRQEFRKEYPLTGYGDSHFGYEEGPTKRPTTMTFGPEFMASHLFQHCPPEDLTLATMMVRPTRLFKDEYFESITTEENYGSVKRAFIVCKDDRSIPKNFQLKMINDYPPAKVKEITGADHMVMISKPKELCSHLLEISQIYS